LTGSDPERGVRHLGADDRGMPVGSLGAAYLGRDRRVGGECNNAREGGSNPLIERDMHPV